MSATLSMQLAQWLQQLTWETLPPRQRELAQLRVLDTLGLALAGSTTEAVRAARALAQHNAPKPAWIALVDGVAAHCYDFDDTFPESVVHPGSAIVPVALALGDELGSSGREVLTAIAGGYEVIARLARAGGKRFHARGFHATGIFAPLAAAFVAARLLRLDVETAASAVGLAASMSGGLLAFLQDGSWSKWLHLGWGNHGGITAAQLAHGGFRGPAGALDGRHNLYEAFIGEPDVDGRAITAELGAVWANETAVFKLYPCAHVIQGYIDAALAERRAGSIDAANIVRVTCAVAPWAIPIVCEPPAEKTAPQTIMQAIGSLPWNVASALIDGRVDLATIGDAQRARADVIALAERTNYVAEPSIAGFDAKLTIETNDGRRFERSAGVAEPGPERLEEKFRALTEPLLGAEGAASALDAVAKLPSAAGVGGVTAVLRRQPTP